MTDELHGVHTSEFTVFEDQECRMIQPTGERLSASDRVFATTDGLERSKRRRTFVESREDADGS
jgi:hypothetical protein